MNALPNGGDRGGSHAAVAVPTVLLFLGSVGGWLAAAAVALTGSSHRWLAVTIPVQALLVCPLFTVAHEAFHDSVGRAKWMSELIGRLAMPFVALWATYPAVRFCHLEHHRNTNENIYTDPDAWASAGPRWLLPLRWMTIDGWYALYYLRCKRGRPRREVIGMWTNKAVVAVLFAVIVGAGYGWDLLVIYLIPQRVGLGILAWWFDWLPHHDLGVTARTDRFRATRARVGWEHLMNVLLIGQNYHLVHHVDPTVSFYQCLSVWRQNEDHYLERNAPITTAWGRDLTPRQYRAWRPARPPVAPRQAVEQSTVIVTLGGATTHTTGAAHETLLDIALRAGLGVPYWCVDGACGICKSKLLRGSVEMGRNLALSESDVADGWVLACQSRPSSDLVHLDYDGTVHEVSPPPSSGGATRR
ncbi:fatty acid desaturase [Mycobacterium sp.]|uniref:fatty acid desaturase n=1 Tax=Mycobacterium sp. TaxID=1785 RepID=UPI0031D8F2CF